MTMTALPSGFRFSQAALQDYVDCPRRFHLRYVRQVAWPAVTATPAAEWERHLANGAAFHRLVQQHLLGIPAERLSHTIADDDLRRWWRNYLTGGPRGLPETRYPETVLSAPLGGYRLVAKYDLVAVAAGERAVIVDWKTARRRPRREHLARRLQTRVYPYLLVRAGAHLGGGQPFAPEQVEMVYWFADFPGQEERFAYDEERYLADEAYLADLVQEITARADDFPLTEETARCRHCPYRSLCRRGERAGPFAELAAEVEGETDFDLSLDIEQIAELAF